MRPRKWTEEQLRSAVASSRSIRQVLKKVGLKEAGGNYAQIQKFIQLFKIDTSHMMGKGWSKGMDFPRTPPRLLSDILVENSHYSSHKLRKRLIKEKLKLPQCEMCSWAEYSKDGRLPLELDHINGVRTDNRLENLRILCPNCHSLQPTHRGCNKKRA